MSARGWRIGENEGGRKRKDRRNEKGMKGKREAERKEGREEGRKEVAGRRAHWREKRKMKEGESA